MQQVLLAVLLDDGARELALLLAGLVVVVVFALLLALYTPIAILAGVDVSAPGSAPVARTVGPAPPSVPVPVSPSPTGEGPVEIALHYLGVPYVFGGSNPAVGLDCSGLVQLVFRQLGITLPRTAQLQYSATARVTDAQLEPGDLVFFARTYADPHDWVTHVGIYAGNGMQINAPTEGQVVSIQPVFSGFWGAHFIGAGRVRHP
jgi:cell wall-associated NlpC family hydrolase